MFCLIRMRNKRSLDDGDESNESKRIRSHLMTSSTSTRTGEELTSAQDIDPEADGWPGQRLETLLDCTHPSTGSGQLNGDAAGEAPSPEL